MSCKHGLAAILAVLIGLAIIAIILAAVAFFYRQALPDAPVEGAQSETIRLAPYGCTKFRISMFPVTPRAWAAGVSP